MKDVWVYWESENGDGSASELTHKFCGAEGDTWIDVAELIIELKEDSSVYDESIEVNQV